MKAIHAAALLLSAAGAFAADFSPESWPQNVRLVAEQQQVLSWAPSKPSITEAKGGIISATVSPIAIAAGLDMLRKGGTAADAAASVALTQVCSELGSVVSYAGIATVVYYDAKTGKVYSLDAGYGTWRDETDPGSIPPADVSALTGGAPPPSAPDLGRQTLVPGFMSGVEALQQRFGRFGLKQSLAPAIWYADHGVTVSPALAAMFQMRKDQMARTEMGRHFLRLSGRDVPLAGDIFLQPELAATLRSVARDGAKAMYTGQWAHDFVAAVTREGGRASLADLAQYRPIWSEAPSTEVFGHTIYTNGGTNLSRYQFLTALNAAEALNLTGRGPYWHDGETLLALTRLGVAVTNAPVLLPAVEAALKTKGADTSPEGQTAKAYAGALADVLPSLYAASSKDTHHSNALVVVDKEGNIAVMTHTINAVVWGDTGIVVGGIPIPDSAGFQQPRLKHIPPGARLPNEIADFLVLGKDKRPTLAGASIGSSLLPEVLRIVVSTVGQGQPLAAVAAAPPLLINPDPASYALPLARQPVLVPAGRYQTDVTATLKATGLTVAEVPAATADALRGTVALVGFDAVGKSAPETPGVMVYTGAE